MRHAPLVLSLLWGGLCGPACCPALDLTVAPRVSGPARPAAPAGPPGERVGIRVLARSPATEYRVPGEGARAPVAFRPLVAACAREAASHGVTLRWDPRLAAAARVLSDLPAGVDPTSGAIRFALLAAGVPEPRARAGIEPLPRPIPGLWDASAPRASAPRASAPRASAPRASASRASAPRSSAPRSSAPRASAPRASASLALPGGLVLRRLCRVVAAAGYNRLGAWVPRRFPRRLVWVALESQLLLEAVPRRPAPGTSVLLRGRLSPGFSSPRTLITGPDGASRPLRLVAATDRNFHVLVPLARGAGVYQVEIVANGPDGPTVLANAPLYVGVLLPDEFLIHVRGGAARPLSRGPRALARALWRRIQEVRAVAGLVHLRWDPRLARVARAHSFGMCRMGRVSHVDPRTGTAADRVRAAGLRSAWVGENVGEGASVAALARAFQASPGHRAVRLAPGARAGGVGVCVQVTPNGGRSLFVTELFLR